tara:strand:- start:44 stop:283 length:240 start_codon:yes stop_codon:yes gene_type:complete
MENNGDNKMTDIAQQIIYDKIKNKIQNEIDHTLTIINKEMEKADTEEKIKNLSNYFIILSNLNQALQLISSIKPTEKQK